MKIMTAEELIVECQKNTEEVYKACNGSSDRMLQLMQYGALMQIAAQLAELNDNLNGVVGTYDGFSVIRVHDRAHNG